ncbi:ABC transporter ATP-binding protein [Micropruina sonneratiae]|uniref:ABC transporter ATP-binding protein n=1 Tax=Micropruina sonneratiae TaxID=2986940 RepID=UPI002226254F|nr:ABC transporter ATP-binding protein [Micropruina sp. KQZ13P-5]MCW3156516.1 ABC transporter ATP-binding protein [Micropruina sp. KQZ13P-5]
MVSQIRESADPATAPTDWAIAAQELRKSYRAGQREVEILHGVSLGVRAGELVAVMGPSGSGKSTLMYCLAGLEAPTSGRVLLAGQQLERLSRADLARMRRSQVGFVFQSYNLIPTLTAAENVALPHLLAGNRPPAELIAQTLETVGLADRADARPPSLSGGEQQRVALARVLAQQPAVLFADEPTGALDTRTGELVLAELARIAHSPGRCALVVTHDPKVAAACDRILFLRDGSLVQELRGASVEVVASTLAGLGAPREA